MSKTFKMGMLCDLAFQHPLISAKENIAKIYTKMPQKYWF